MKWYFLTNFPCRPNWFDMVRVRKGGRLIDVYSHGSKRPICQNGSCEKLTIYSLQPIHESTYLHHFGKQGTTSNKANWVQEGDSNILSKSHYSCSIKFMSGLQPQTARFFFFDKTTFSFLTNIFKIEVHWIVNFANVAQTHDYQEMPKNNCKNSNQQ